MELRKIKGINIVPKIDEVRRICETMEHPTNECPTIPTFKEVLHDQANAMNMVKTSVGKFRPRLLKLTSFKPKLLIRFIMNKPC